MEGRRGRRFGSLPTMSEINIVPLVDVVLVLLIIFMITANVMEFGLDIKVPEVRITRDSTQELPVVNISKSGDLFLNNTPVNVNVLPKRFVANFTAQTPLTSGRIRKRRGIRLHRLCRCWANRKLSAVW